jgi:hypothetical protein
MSHAMAYVTWFGLALTIVVIVFVIAASWPRRQRGLGSVSDQWLAQNRGHV